MAETLLQRIARGDQNAVEACLDTFGGLVWSLAKKYVASRADVEDAVQDIFVAIWKAADRYDPAVASEAAFIATIARRRLIDRNRRAAVRPDVATLPDESDAFRMPDMTSHGADIADEAARAAEALKQLRPEQQKVVWLAVYHGWAQSEIAEKLDLPLGTVKTHVRRGLIKIREVLGVTRDTASQEVAS